MLRNLVSLQLIVTLLAGPWLCCCTVERLLAHDHEISAASSDPIPEVRTFSCCSHHTCSDLHPETGHSDSGNPKPSKHEHCPCKDHPTLGLVQSVEANANVSNWLRLMNIDLLASSDSLLVGRTLTLREDDSGRSYSGCALYSVSDEQLYAHHNLRC